MPPLIRYDKEKQRIYSLENSPTRTGFEEAREVLSALLPPTIKVKLQNNLWKNRNKPERIVIGPDKYLFRSMSTRDWNRFLRINNIKIHTFRFSTKGRYLNVRNILKVARDQYQVFDPLLLEHQEKEKLEKAVLQSINRLRKTLNFIPGDSLSADWYKNQERPFQLTLSLVSEEEVRAVYILVREICSV